MTNKKHKLIAQGAEAKIWLTSKGFVIKERQSKGYRHPVLDRKIIRSRTKREAKILAKANELGINVPEVLEASQYGLKIEFIKGDKISETLNSYSKERQFEVMKKIGKQVGLLHKNKIIHGDLTTSNVILKEKEVFLIDFGLGFISSKIEDMAVDLHLIKQALEAKHYQNHEELFESFLNGYNWTEKKKVLDRLKVVERRGRYRH